jgi:hypothetical protein
MSAKETLKSAWKVVSREPGVVRGVVMIVSSLTDLVIQILSRKKPT